MKRSTLTTRILAAMAGTACLVGSQTVFGQAPTAFSYQGRLTNAGSAATGLYDIQFTVWSTLSGPGQVGSVVTVPNVQVTNGLFTAPVDFSPAKPFQGARRWLEIAVRPASSGGYTTLSPRTELTPTPYATYALGPWETVTGQAYPNNGYYLRAGDGSYFGMDSDFGDLHVNGGNDGIFGITSDGPAGGSFNISTSGTSRFKIENGTGRISIGNSVPFPAQARLDVSTDDTTGIRGHSTNSIGIAGSSGIGIGVHGTGEVGVQGAATFGKGVEGLATSGTGVRGSATQNGFGVAGNGVIGTATGGRGVQGTAVSGRGVEGFSITGIGVTGDCTSAGTYGFLGDPSAGVFGSGGSSHFGVSAHATGSGIGGAAIFAHNSNPVGIALVTSTNSGDANTVLINTGTGHLIKCFSGPGGGNEVFTVTNCGTAIAKVIQIQGGCDVAEPFHVAKSADQPAIEPGMVVAIDPDNPGCLMLTDRPYDTRVAGIISGANGLAPGLTLSSDDHAIVRGEHPVAMTGRVWCRVDANAGAIKPGDMLTTAAMPGTAMKAGDASQSHGAVIGKAMTGLDHGRGLVLVLVNLQ